MKRKRPPCPIPSIAKLLEQDAIGRRITDTPNRDGFFIGEPKDKVDYVIAPRPSQLEQAPVPGSEQRPCSVCLTLLWVSRTSRAMMATGAPLMCPDCMLRRAGKPQA